MRSPRAAFTLFELILAIALSAALLALIGTAINLYLMQVDASRTRVEEAQLARSILAMIADDLRAAAVYDPQDTSAMAELVARSAAGDNEDNDDDNDSNPDGDDGQNGENGDDAGATDGPSGAGGTGGVTSIGGQSSSASRAGSFGASVPGEGDELDGTLPLGLNGTLVELYIDVARLPRREELFRKTTGYTNAPAPLPSADPAASTDPAALVPPADVKTVRYFLRPGAAVDPASQRSPPTSPTPEEDLAAGLVRQQIPRRSRVWAEQAGNTTLLAAGQRLLAPEVLHLEFRYYDGQLVTDQWDMRQQRALPLAVEVRIWLATPETLAAASEQPHDTASRAATAHEYRQTVYLPMAAISGAEQGGAAGTGTPFSDSATSGDSSSPKSPGSNPSFNQP